MIVQGKHKQLVIIRVDVGAEGISRASYGRSRSGTVKPRAMGSHGRF